MKLRTKIVSLLAFLALAAGHGVFLFAGETPRARGKTEIIGTCSWFTEQNSFEEITRQANKAGKPILAVFSATWCKPCRHVKKTVFKTPAFKQVADRALLLYIEETTKEGKAYKRKFKIKSFPTFKVFSAQGVLLETGHPERSVQGFVRWIKEVKAGNNFYQFSRKLEKNPDDREILVKITDKMAWKDSEKKKEYLKRAIKLNPAFNDPLSQQAYEKLARLLMAGIPYKDGKKKKRYLNHNRKLFLQIFNAYYPGKFKYSLKGFPGLWVMINWFKHDREHDRAIALFKDYVKGKKGNMALVDSLPLLASAFNSFLESGKIEEARQWLKNVEEIGRTDKKASAVKGFAYNYFNMYRDIVKYYGERKDIPAAEKYAERFYREMERFGRGKELEEAAYEFAAHYGIFASRAIQAIDGKLKTAKGGKDVSHLVSGKARVLAKTGNKKEARRQLTALYENHEFMKSLSGKETAGVLNVLAWTMVELDLVDEKTLEMAKKAVALHPSSGMILDTLACAYAGLGQYKKALEVEEKALKNLENKAFKEDFKARIREWKEKLK
jgi:thiol-disulfide isomerase/thioredoxin